MGNMNNKEKILSILE